MYTDAYVHWEYPNIYTIVTFKYLNVHKYLNK